jgi:type III pantothenate kinase
MNLVLDIGNTVTKCGLFSTEQELLWFSTTPTDSKTFSAIAAEIANKASKLSWQWSGSLVAVSSVVPSAGTAFCNDARKAGAKIFEISASTQNILTGVSNAMGADRVAEAVGAWTAYRVIGRPMIVLGLGTASTMLTINEHGCVGGGFIGPGVTMILEGLARKCALLPRTDLSKAKTTVGYTTESQMDNGVLLLVRGMIHEWLEVAKAEFEQTPVVVVTGGWSLRVAEQFPTLFDTVDVPLALKGSAQIVAQSLVDGSGRNAKKTITTQTKGKHND